MNLQRCPNCGGPPKLHNKRGRYYYECAGDCWTQTDKYSTPEQAAEEWNSLKPTRTNHADDDDLEYIVISVSDWKRYYKELTTNLEPYDHYDTGYGDAVDRVDDWLDVQPHSTQAAPATGHWEFVNDYESRCSNCGENSWIDHNNEHRFCPNCGAKMASK